LLAHDESLPAFLNSSSGGRNGVRDVSLEFGEDGGPLGLHGDPHVSKDILSALGALIASLEERSILLFGFGECGLVNCFAVLLDEWFGLIVVEAGDLILNVVEVLDFVRVVGH